MSDKKDFIEKANEIKKEVETEATKLANEAHNAVNTLTGKFLKKAEI